MLGHKEKMYMHFHGRLDSKNGVGVNNLIKEGAKMAVCVDDILNDFVEFKYKKKRIIHTSKYRYSKIHVSIKLYYQLREYVTC